MNRYCGIYDETSSHRDKHNKENGYCEQDDYSKESEGK